jgi:hypothetical protein
MSIRCGVSRKMISARRVPSPSQPPEAATGMIEPSRSAWSETAQAPAPTGTVRALDRSARVSCQPQGVGDRLHAGGVGGGGDHRVLLGQDHAELPEGPVAAVAVPGHPELEAVALPPVGIGLGWVADLL